LKLESLAAERPLDPAAGDVDEDKAANVSRIETRNLPIADQLGSS